MLQKIGKKSHPLAGPRSKTLWQQIAAGLYLGQRQGTPEEVRAAPGAERMQVTKLPNIDANEPRKLFTRGVQDNVPKEQMSRLIPALMRMSQVFSDQKKLIAGDVFIFDCVPGTGTDADCQRRIAGRAVLEAGVLQRHAAHLAGPTASGLQAERRAA